MRSLITIGVPLLALSWLLSGCGQTDQAPQHGASQASPPTAVGTVSVTAETLPLYVVLNGRVRASLVAEVRARTAGIIQSRDFIEGGSVKAGQTLFKIDPAPAKAVLAQAEANLARSQADLKQATHNAERYQPLLKSNAVSQQQYDDAAALQAQMQASVAAAQAAVDTARLNLAYATVEAPISGRIGAANVTVGALVGQGESTALATIQCLDPIQIDLVVPSDDLSPLRQALQNNKIVTATIIDDSGAAHSVQGKVLFIEPQVDRSTGSVTVRAELANPDSAFLPGMYIRAQLDLGVEDGAFALPQQSVLQATAGASVIVIDAQGAAAPIPVNVQRRVGDRWVVTGVEAGQNVVAEGFQSIRPGAVFTPVPWTPPTADKKMQAADTAPAQ